MAAADLDCCKVLCIALEFGYLATASKNRKCGKRGIDDQEGSLVLGTLCTPVKLTFMDMDGVNTLHTTVGAEDIKVGFIEIGQMSPNTHLALPSLA